MIHYIYKIHFLCEEPGNYYIGKRSYRGINIERDKYCGSGRYCDFYFKKHGIKLGVTYTKEILEINSNKKLNSDREKYWVGDLWNTDPLCKNLIPGGDWIEGEVAFSKAVIQYDLHGNELARFDSQLDGAFAVGLQTSSGISLSCLDDNMKLTSGGYLWRFVDDPILESDLSKLEERWRPVKQYDLTGEFIQEFISAADAHKATHVSSSSILECCKRIRRHRAGDYIWRFKEDAVSEDDIKNANFYKVITINQYNSKGDLINSFPSLKEAADSVGGKWQCIQASCNNKSFAYGYIWLRSNESIGDVDLKNIKRGGSRTIYQYSLQGELIKTFDTLKEASISIKVPWQYIQNCCNRKVEQVGGFIWKRDEWK